MKPYNLTVIGGGSGGLVVALGAAGRGMRVALIEKDKLGGDCLWTGCVPSKTLLHSARIIQSIREAERAGLEKMEPAFSPAAVLDHVRSVRARIAEHDDPERFREEGVEVIFGSPRFLDPRRIEVGDRIIESEKFVIATGSRPRIFPIPGLDETGYLTNEDVFSLRDLPASLIQIGGGPISVELGQAFRRLGIGITILDKAPEIMPKEDADLVGILRKRLEREGVRIVTGVDITGIREEGDQKVVAFEKDGKKEEVRAEEILAAMGRTPNIEGLDLEKAGVEYAPAGIEVDEHLRTTAPNIWAVGDVKNKYLFTHAAEYEGRTVVQNALFPFKKKISYRTMPWCTFTEPELARVGLSRKEAEESGEDFKLLQFPYADVDRAVTDGETEGVARIICSKKGKILGATIVGANAGELIHEWVLAMQADIPVTSISGMIHIYPTLSRLSRKVADTYYEDILDGWKGKLLNRIAKLFNR